jgi:hypothetical protein
MSSDYRVGAGWGLALASLTRLATQPASSGVKATETVYFADGSVYVQGLYIELLYNTIFGTTRYQSVLSAFGLVAARSAQITIYCPDDLLNYTRYNGVAVRPEPNRNNYMIRDTTILVRNLKAL